MERRDVKNLIQRLAAEEAGAGKTTFLAPCLPGAKLRVRVAGMVQTYRPAPPDFEGWGLFSPADAASAALVEEPLLPEITHYLEMLRPVRLRLAHALRGRTWLAYPVNESDFRQRIGEPRPLLVHLTEDAAPFETVIARWDGAAFWFEQLDRKADPVEGEALRQAMAEIVLPERLRRKGLTPEARAAYGIAALQAPGFDALRTRRRIEDARDRDGARIGDALRVGGGSLQSHQDRGDFWLVEWTDREGRQHTSAIGKQDLTVVSSGICLSGQDRDFDLSSLVGVMAGWDGY